jgi:uncharacterized membrane protein YeiB
MLRIISHALFQKLCQCRKLPKLHKKSASFGRLALSLYVSHAIVAALASVPELQCLLQAQ